MSWDEYGVELEANLRDLHDRVHRGAYRALPVRRVFVPKPDGRLRPLGVAALEDKILQRVVVEVLNAVYEQDFVGFSYGFRPGCSPHDALDALSAGIYRGKVSWVLDADIRDFFGQLDQGWLLKFLEHRIADQRVLRLIQKWLSAGVIENTGNGQRQTPGRRREHRRVRCLPTSTCTMSLTCGLDQWRRRNARGEVICVRFADDYVAGFQHRDDAERFLAELRGRLANFGLELAGEKTRLIEFGRFAARDRARRGDRKPETFEFLGFTHMCATGRNGRFKLKRVTSKKKMRAKLKSVKIEMRWRMHQPIPEQGAWLARVVSGHYRYYTVPDNIKALRAFRKAVMWHWRRSLSRRSQKGYVPCSRMWPLADRWLPQPRILHPWPVARFDAKTQTRSPVR